MAALMILLINKHGQESVDLIQVVLNNIIFNLFVYDEVHSKKKQKRQKWERKKLQLSQETFKLLFYTGSEVQRRFFCRTCKRTENRRTCCDSLTSSAAAEKRQDISSKNTTDELADAVTGGNGIGLRSSITTEKMREYWLKNETLFLKIWCSTTQKRQKLVAEIHHKSYSPPEPQRRSRWKKLALFFSFRNLCLLFRM